MRSGRITNSQGWIIGAPRRSPSHAPSFFLSDLNRYAVSDWVGEIVVGVSFSRVGIAVGIASDDLDSKLVQLLEPFFCVG